MIMDPVVSRELFAWLEGVAGLSGRVHNKVVRAGQEDRFPRVVIGEGTEAVDHFYAEPGRLGTLTFHTWGRIDDAERTLEMRKALLDRLDGAVAGGVMWEWEFGTLLTEPGLLHHVDRFRAGRVS